MHIVTIIRLNPVLTDELELTNDGTDIDREWIGVELNPLDDQALEQAVLLKEQTGARVTAIACEAEGGEKLLKTALARGRMMFFLFDLSKMKTRLHRPLVPGCHYWLMQLVICQLISF